MTTPRRTGTGSRARNVQWAHGFPPADGWKRLNNSAIAQGWTWHVWPYAYNHPTRAWHFFSAGGQHALRESAHDDLVAVWRRRGAARVSVSARHGSDPRGTNAGTDPDFGAYSLTEDPFYIGRHEVTKALWDQVRTWALANGYTFDNPGAGKAADHPVHTINWYDAVKWCNARSEMEGRRRCIMPAA
jgi:hypothetical protein